MTGPAVAARPTAERWLPSLGVARGYRHGWLYHDLFAGLVLTAVLVPAGMAYAGPLGSRRSMVSTRLSPPWSRTPSSALHGSSFSQAGDSLHDAYLQVTTTTFLAIVVCQIGTAFAARTEHSSLRTIGVTTNRLLLWGILFELVHAGAVIYRTIRDLLNTAALGPNILLFVAPFAFIVLGTDDLRR